MAARGAEALVTALRWGDNETNGGAPVGACRALRALCRASDAGLRSALDADAEGALRFALQSFPVCEFVEETLNIFHSLVEERSEAARRLEEAARRKNARAGKL